MKTARSSITRLKTNIEKEFGKASDLNGFDGIDTDMLIDSLTESYGLLEGLVDKKETFDVIFMKRKLSDLTRLCNEYLTSGTKGIDKEKKFNSFLNNISEIRSVIKKTYLLVVEESIRDESEVLRLRSDLAEYKEVFEQYLSYKNEVTDSYEKINELRDDLEHVSKRYSNAYSEIAETLDEGEKSLAKINGILDESISDQEEVINSRAQIVKNKVLYKNNIKRYELLLGDLDGQRESIAEQFTNCEKLSEDLNTQKGTIQNILDDANRASMAGSFLKRKNELAKPIFWSSFGMTSMLILTAIVSGYLLFNSGLLSKEFDYVSFLTKIPIVAPLIWVAWSNSQRNNYLVRIQEDYAFKYASAMAFEGYKQQVQEVDENLQSRLLTLAVENMGANPIRLFDKKVKASPMQDVFHGVTSTLSTVNPMKRSKEEVETEK